MSENYDDVLNAYIKKFSLPIKDHGLLRQAMTHRSYVPSSYPSDAERHNDTLEFLGDSILGYVVSSYLLKNYPSFDQGILSQKKSVIVSKESLYKISQKLELLSILRYRGISIKEGEFSSVLADAVEALIAAIYLSEGLETSRTFILKIFQDIISKTIKNKYNQDYKSVLQEYCQKHFQIKPEYVLIATKGPDHKKLYTTKIHIQNKSFGPCTSSTKRHSEQLVAEKALRYYLG